METFNIIPEGYCKNCAVCCRFPESESELRPTFFATEILDKKLFPILDNIRPSKIELTRHKDYYICPHFKSCSNSCNIYVSRPFDCRLYPFMITYDKDYSSIQLVADTKCPFIRDSKNLESHAKELLVLLEKDLSAQNLYKNFAFINNYQPDAIPLFTLTKLTGLIFKGRYGFRKFSLEDAGIFNEYFSKFKADLSAYSFVYLFAFSDIINTLWKIEDNILYAFWDTGSDFFMPHLPLGKATGKKEIAKAIKLMQKISKTPPRIENIPKDYAGLLETLEFTIKKSEDEYIINPATSFGFRGNRLKSKRALYNYFIKNTPHRFVEFDSSIIKDALGLYKRWAAGRLEKYPDPFYKSLLEDGILVHKKILENFDKLPLLGLFLEIDGRISAYTVGYPLNDATFVVFLEIADLKFKGISEFIFGEFSKILGKYKFLDIMGDSGLENLKKTKLSYHPEKILAIYSASKIDRQRQC